MASVVWAVALPASIVAGPESPNSLVRDLTDTVSATKGPAAATRLVEMGSGAASVAGEVTVLLKHANPVIRARAATVLGEIDPTKAQPLLHELAKTDSDIGVRRAAVAALSDEAILVAFASSPARPLREAAAAKLAGSPRLVELASQPGDAELRGDLVFALSDAKAVRQIAGGDRDPQVRRWAAAALAADPRKDLRLGKGACRVTPVRKNEFTGACVIAVANEGAAAYDDIFVTAARSATGWPAPLRLERLEPGDRREVPFDIVLPDEDAGSMEFQIVRATKHRPAVKK